MSKLPRPEQASSHPKKMVPTVQLTVNLVLKGQQHPGLLGNTLLGPRGAPQYSWAPQGPKHMSSQGTPETQGQREALEVRGRQGSPSPGTWGGRGEEACKVMSILKPSSQPREGERCSLLDKGSTVASGRQVGGWLLLNQLGVRGLIL